MGHNRGQNTKRLKLRKNKCFSWPLIFCMDGVQTFWPRDFSKHSWHISSFLRHNLITRGKNIKKCLRSEKDCNYNFSQSGPCVPPQESNTKFCNTNNFLMKQIFTFLTRSAKCRGIFSTSTRPRPSGCDAGISLRRGGYKNNCKHPSWKSRNLFLRSLNLNSLSFDWLFLIPNLH